MQLESKIFSYTSIKSHCFYIQMSRNDSLLFISEQFRQKPKTFEFKVTPKAKESFFNYSWTYTEKIYWFFKIYEDALSQTNKNNKTFWNWDK